METLEALAGRISTTEDIQSIVRTMKSLSAVSIRQYERAVEALHGYQETIELGFQAVLRENALPMPARGRGVGRFAAIVIGSDRGLCGRFNEGLVDFVEKQLSERNSASETSPLVLAVGGRAAARLEAVGRPPNEMFVLPGSVGGLVNTAHSIIIQMEQWQREKQAGHIDIFFNHRTAEARAKPTARRLTPISTAYLKRLKGRPWPSRRLPAFSMSGEALFSWLVRQYLFVSVYRAGAESLASEHASRLAAMQAAERNIDERLDELSGEYRKKRQESITTELMDIVAGFEAMRSPDEIAS